MIKKFRFGIIGCGMIAGIHAEAIRSLPDAQLVGATDNNFEKRLTFCQKYAIMPYESTEALLADAAVDAVCICTPSCFHADTAIAALYAGKHVVLEKPMALHTEDADRVIAACHATGRKLTVISQLRFSPDVQHVKTLMEQQAFGQLIFCNLSMRYWRSEEYFTLGGWKGKLAFEGGGALMNQGIHGIDLLQYLAGMPTVLGGLACTRHHAVEVEDTAAALVRFDNGAMGTIEASTCTWPGFERRLEIHGDHGYVILRENAIERMEIPGESVDRTQEAAEVGSCSRPEAIGHAMHALQIGDLIRAVRGESAPLVDAAEGKKALQIIQAIYEVSAQLCTGEK